MWIRILFLLCVCLPLQGEVSLKVPDHFSVTERFFALTTTFDLQTDTEPLATVYRKFFSLTPEYHLVSPHDEFLAKGRMRFWNLGACFDITDHQNRPLGCVYQTFSWFFPTFKITAPSSEVIAKAVENFWGTKWTIKNPQNGDIIAIFSCPFFWWKKDWSVRIENPSFLTENQIHPHLFFTFLAFQLDRDHWRSYAHLLNLHQMSLKDGSCFPEIPDADPAEEDFLFIEAFVEEMETELGDSEEEVKTELIFSRLIDALTADELTPNQKAALKTMLEQRLER